MAGTILTNLANYAFGVPDAETSMNVNKITFKRQGEKIEVRKRIGGYAGRVDHTFKWTASLSGEMVGSSSGYVGQIYTIASATALGVGTGAWVIDDYDLAHENNKLSMFTINATGYDSDDIAAGASQTGTPGSPPSFGP